MALCAVKPPVTGGFPNIGASNAGSDSISWMDHYSDIIMDMMASQTTSLTIVYSTIYSDADQRKYQSSASLAFMQGIHQWPVNSPHKWPVTRIMFPFDDVIMLCYCSLLVNGARVTPTHKSTCTIFPAIRRDSNHSGLKCQSLSWSIILTYFHISSKHSFHSYIMGPMSRGKNCPRAKFGIVKF